MRRILSFHIISQVEYIALALSIYSPLAISAGVFYLIHYIVVKGNLSMVTRTGRRARRNKRSQKSLWNRSKFPLDRRPFCGSNPLPVRAPTAFRVLCQAHPAQREPGNSSVGCGSRDQFSRASDAFLHAEDLERCLFGGKASSQTKIPPKTLLATSGALALVTILLGLASGLFLQLASDAAATLLEPSARIRAVL